MNLYYGGATGTTAESNLYIWIILNQDEVYEYIIN